MILIITIDATEIKENLSHQSELSPFGLDCFTALAVGKPA